MRNIRFMMSLWFALLSATSAFGQTCPARAYELTSGVGINTHDNWAGTYSATSIENGLGYLGITRVRDGGLLRNPAFVQDVIAMAKVGASFDIVQSTGTDSDNMGQINLPADMAAMVQINQQVPHAVTAYEGANEANVNSFYLNGISSLNNPTWGIMNNKASVAALMQNSATARIASVGVSNAGTNSTVVIAGSTDYASLHPYAGIGEQLGANIRAGVATAQATMEGGPVRVTETGAGDIPANETTWGTAGDRYTQAIFVLNALLDSFNAGIDQTYLYEMYDTAVNSMSLEDHFGLFDYYHSPKPAAIALANLIAILNDHGPAPSSFSPTAIYAYVQNLPSTAISKIFQESDGSYDIVLWNSEATVWSNGAEATVMPVNVYVGFGGTYHNVNVYDPMISRQPIQNANNNSGVTVALAKEPIIIKISSPWTAPQSNVLCARDLITIATSEDAYNGDAQFTVTVDGVSTGMVYTATAAHAAGALSNTYIAGNWGPGLHTISVSFINDAWGGTPSLDRNLYITAVAYNSVVTRVSNIALLGNGTTNFPTNN